METQEPSARGRWLRRFGKGSALALVALVGLFVWNGLEPSWRTPEFGVTSHGERPPGDTLTVMAFNIAKCDFHRRGLEFASPEEVRVRLDRIAEVVLGNDVDLLFFSEIVLEAFPCRVNQVEYLAEKAQFAHWAYGDNYSFGLPGLRIRAGNAILSRLPLEALAVQQLPGGTPFWNPTGNRRVLWADVQLGDQTLRCGSIRNDSFRLDVNAEQVAVLLDELPSGPVLLAGDFNATPADPPMALWRASPRFGGVFDGAATYPSDRPTRRLDTVLVPAEWPLDFEGGLQERVLDVNLSDHEPVVVTARWRKP